MSGLTAVLGHALGGAHVPGSAAVVLVVLCSAVVGAIASTVLVRRVAAVAVCLSAGQLVGHCLLGVAADAPHGMSGPSMPMLAAHVAAAVLTAGLVCTAERLFAAVALAVWRLVLVLIALTDAGSHRIRRLRWRTSPSVARSRALCDRVTRGPPSFAAA